VGSLAILACLPPSAHAAAVVHHHHHHLHRRALASNVIVPQARAFNVHRRPAVGITGVKAGVVILQQAATTTLDVSLRNPGGARQEAELIVPVPDGAVVRGFTFQGAAKEPKAEVLPADEARRTYDAIVAKIRDPALLEFIGYNLVRSSVFPVPARGTQEVRLTYEHLLPADGNRVDYVLPRSESLDYSVPWEVSVRITSKTPLSTVYSPTHELEKKRVSEHVMSARIAPQARTEPGPFRLAYLVEGDGVTASLLAYPDPEVGGGYFLLLAGLPAALPKTKEDGTPAIKREVILVLDRSGSMRGEKLEQAREAALQVIAGLEKGEAFNILAYSNAVDPFAERPVPKTAASVKAAEQYLKSINAQGGTNIHDALVEALRQKPTKDTLPVVLFLTDGLPTVGQTSEAAIRDVALKANPHDRRIFTFGVGVDVNTPLLDKIARETRATATYVLPKEDVEVKVAQTFKRLAGPVLAGPTLKVVDENGQPTPKRVRDLVPSQLPDLFEGDQLVLLGQYLGEEPLHFRVKGNYLGRQRTFKFSFGLEKATTRNAFVPRLWASRKIAVLVDAIRQLGANGAPATVAAAAATDPRLKELVDEIVRLSTEFGILTEYTAFLAREGTDLANRDEVLREANRNFVGRAISARSGIGSLNQSFNYERQIGQKALNRRNEFYDAKMNRVAVRRVQQISDRAFYRRGNRWVDSRVVQQEKSVTPEKTVTFGSEEFHKLATKLATQGRQGCIALHGEILLVVDGKPLLVKSPEASAAAAAAQAETKARK
jgi:Ca-activated chloride channel family protein